MTARIAAAWPRCSGWVTPLPVTLRKVHRRAGDQAAAGRGQQDRHTQVYVGQHDGGVDRLRTVRKDRRDRSWRSPAIASPSCVVPTKPTVADLARRMLWVAACSVVAGTRSRRHDQIAISMPCPSFRAVTSWRRSKLLDRRRWPPFSTSGQR